MVAGLTESCMIIFLIIILLVIFVLLRNAKIKKRVRFEHAIYGGAKKKTVKKLNKTGQPTDQQTGEQTGQQTDQIKYINLIEGYTQGVDHPRILWDKKIFIMAHIMGTRPMLDKFMDVMKKQKFNNLVLCHISTGKLEEHLKIARTFIEDNPNRKIIFTSLINQFSGTWVRFPCLTYYLNASFEEELHMLKDKSITLKDVEEY